MTPLRGQKSQYYEGGIRVPLIVAAPGVTTPGSVCSEPVTSTDFYPTMLELAGLEAMPRQHLDGLSLVPLLRGGRHLRRDAIYWHFPLYHFSCSAVRSGDWKLIEFFEDDRIELYNLAEDIGETNDLSGSYPGRAKNLRQMLHRWRKQVDASIPKPNPDYRPAQDR